MKVKFTMPKGSGLKADFNIDKTKTIALKSELNAEIEARIEGDNTLQSEITRIENEIPDISGLATKTELQEVENEIPDISGLATKTELQAVENEIPDISNLATKNELQEVEESIPIVNNGILTIIQNGETKGVFRANDSNNVTVNLEAGGGGGAVNSVNGQTGDVVLTASDVGALPNTTVIPTKTSDLTNDSGYITGVAWNDVTNKPNFATVATSGSYNDLSNKPTIPSAQVNSDWNAVSGVAQILNKPTIPTKTSDLTNDSGYITNSALSGYATEIFVTSQGYITGITSSDVTTALGYTPYNASNPDGYITSSAIANMQTTTNLVTSVSSSSTDSQYPSAKLFYDTVGDIETLLQAV